MINADIKLDEFKEKVFEEYRVIKAFRMGESKIENDRKNTRGFARPFILLAELFVNKILQSEANKRDIEGILVTAKNLLEQKEIHDRVCETLTKSSKLEILTEEKFTAALTESFFQSPLANQFNIPAKPILYAMMAIEVFETGIENYCNSQE